MKQFETQQENSVCADLPCLSDRFLRDECSTWSPGVCAKTNTLRTLKTGTIAVRNHTSKPAFAHRTRPCILIKSSRILPRKQTNERSKARQHLTQGGPDTEIQKAQVACLCVRVKCRQRPSEISQLCPDSFSALNFGQNLSSVLISLHLPTSPFLSLSLPFSSFLLISRRLFPFPFACLLHQGLQPGAAPWEPREPRRGGPQRRCHGHGPPTRSPEQRQSAAKEELPGLQRLSNLRHRFLDSQKISADNKAACWT